MSPAASEDCRRDLIGLTAIRQLRIVDAGIYLVMQLAGGTLGALLTKELMTGVNPGVHYGAPGLQLSRVGTTLGGMGAEGVGTLFLVLAVVAVAVNPTGLKDWSGLVIGGTLGFSVMITAPLTGGSINPARAFGPALVAHHWGGAGKWLLVYALAPAVGGVVAAAGYFWSSYSRGRRA